MEDVLQRAAAEAAAGTFLGGPPDRFAEAGRHQLDLLVAGGLKPHHRVLDVGSGPFRAGLWLMDFLEPGNYFALEPSRELVAAGRRIIGEERWKRARPTIAHDDGFDPGVFDALFDYGVARSIWTHTSMNQIRRLLVGWRPHGHLYASYLPARGRPAYRGDRWVGISHESSEPGLVRHRLRNIRKAAAEAHVEVERVSGWRMGGQRWLRISGAHTLD